MKLVPDVSFWQSGGGSSNALGVEEMGQQFAGCFVRMGDYIEFYSYGPDRYYTDTVQRLQSVGCHASGYLYPRPAMDDPVTAIDNWFSVSPPFTLAPMLDPEGPGMGGMSGWTLTQWIDEALARMAQLWPQWLPVFYSSRAFTNGYGVSRPSTPHILMLAEYHYGYQPFDWSWWGGWEAHAMSAYGGPDLPDGYDHWDVWQFSSSAANVPGTGGNLDMSIVQDASWALLTGTDLPAPAPPPPNDEDLMKQFITPDGTVWLQWGIFRTALDSDGLRHAMMELGILDPVLTPVHPWTLAQLVEVPRDVFIPKAQLMAASPGEATAAPERPQRRFKLPGSTNANAGQGPPPEGGVQPPTP